MAPGPDDLPFGAGVVERLRDDLAEYVTPRIEAAPPSDVADIVLDASQWRKWSDIADAVKQASIAPAGNNLDALLDVIVWGDMSMVEPPYRIVARNLPSVRMRKDAEFLAVCIAEGREEYFARRGVDRQVSMAVEVAP
jgi:RNAse (barnase) inhibitor barstar